MFEEKNRFLKFHWNINKNVVAIFVKLPIELFVLIVTRTLPSQQFDMSLPAMTYDYKYSIRASQTTLVFRLRSKEQQAAKKPVSNAGHDQCIFPLCFKMQIKGFVILLGSARIKRTILLP